jgi:hypothetical protein
MNTNANVNAITALTPELMATLPPEIAAMMAAMQQQLAETQAALAAAQTRKTRAPKPPKDIWSNSSLLIDGNDHARLLVTLAVMTRDGQNESDITQCDWVRHCMALSIALGAYKATATQGIAEASTRTAAGQLRRAREVLDLTKLQDKVKSVVLADWERAMYDHYKDRDLFGGAKEDSDKRWSRQRCELLRANWRDNWTADNDWRPTDDGTLPLFIDDPDDESDNDGANGEI